MEKLLVKVEWRDTRFNGDWLTDEQAKKWARDFTNYPIISFGLLVEETDDFIILGSGFDSSDGIDWETICVLPKINVLKITRLKKINIHCENKLEQSNKQRSKK